MNKTRLAATGALIAVLTGCSATKGDAPEPTGDKIKPGVNTRVIQMPDGFRNIAATCEGATGIYVTSRGDTGVDPQPSGVAVVLNDPACSR
jgi:hypothetical protein